MVIAGDVTYIDVCAGTTMGAAVAAITVPFLKTTVTVPGAKPWFTTSAVSVIVFPISAVVALDLTLSMITMGFAAST